MKKYLPEIGLVFIAIIWGSGFVATQIAIDSGITPNQLMTLRFFIASVLLTIIFWKNIKNVNKKTLKSGIIIGIFLFLGFVFQTYGIVYTTPSKNAFITSTGVVIVPFIGFFLYKYKIDKIGLISSIVALLGIGILSLNDNMSVNIGDVLTLICAFAFAMHLFFNGEYTKDNDPIAIATIQMITVFVFSLILLLVTKETNIPMHKTGITATLYLAILNTTLAFLIQTICQSKTTSTKTAIILSTEAVFGTIFSVIILSEEITFRMIIGCIMIFIAIIAAETKFSFLNLNKKDDKDNLDIVN